MYLRRTWTRVGSKPDAAPLMDRWTLRGGSNEPLPKRARDPLLDLLRSLALGRIILWHLFAQSWLTWIAALPVMFFVLGTVGRSGQGRHVEFVQRRARRLLIPFWAYAFAVVGFSIVYAVTTSSTIGISASQLFAWIVPLIDPTSMPWTGGWLSSHLWYLRAVLWITLLMPVLRMGAKHLRISAVTSVGGLALLMLASYAHVPVLSRGHVHVLLGDALAYGFFAVLGISYRSGALSPSIRSRSLTAIIGWASALTYSVMIGVPVGGVNSSYPLIVLLGVATLATLSLAERPLQSVAERSRVSAATRRISSRSLSIYLWHPLCIVVASHLIPLSGAAGSIGRLAFTLGLVAVVVGSVGWIEDVAAAKRVGGTTRPERTRRIAVGVAATMIAFVSVLRGSWVSAAAVQTLNSGSLVPNIPAPSSRAALSDSAFASSDASPATEAAAATIPSRSSAPPRDGEVVFEPAWKAMPTMTPSTTIPARTIPASSKADASTGVALGARQMVTTPKPAAKTTTSSSTVAVKRAPSSTVPARGRPSVASPVSTTTPQPAAGLATPTTAAVPKQLPAEKLQRAFDTWRSQQQPMITSSVVALRRGDASWTSRSADPGVDAKYLTTREFRASSITKTFTAALVLRAVDRGALRLDDQVPSLLGVATSAPEGLTVRQLLTHTSGLVDYREANGYDAAAPLTAADAVTLSFRTPLITGGPVSYANSNYLALGLLIEQIEAKPYAQLVGELFSSFGLTDTRLDEVTQPGWIGFSSGGIMSTTTDLARWGQALFTPGRVLSDRALRLMTTIGDANLGLGAWPACPCSTDASGVKGYTAVGHQTADGGMFFFPATGITVVAMFEPTGHDTHSRIVSLAAALTAALG